MIEDSKVRPWLWALVIIGLTAFLIFSWLVPVLPIAVAGWGAFVIGLVILAGLNWKRLSNR